MKTKFFILSICVCTLEMDTFEVFHFVHSSFVNYLFRFFQSLKNEFFRSQNDCSFSSISFVPSVKKSLFLKEIFENIVRSVKKRLFFL